MKNEIVSRGVAGVRAVLSQARALLPVIALLSMLATSVVTFAQETGPEVPVFVTQEEFSDLLGSFIANVGPIILLVIGASFGVAGLVMVLRWFGKLVFRK